MRRVAGESGGLQGEGLRVVRRGGRAREALVDDEGVEGRAGPGELLHLRQAQVLVREQRRLAFLEAGEEVDGGLPAVEPYPYGQRVDEQADHGFHVRQVVRAARDGGAEDHVGAAGQPG